MKHLIFISTCFISACGPTPDFETKYGIEVWDKYGLSEEERGHIDVGVSLLIKEFQKQNFGYMKRFKNHLQDSTLVMLPEPFDCDAGQNCKKAAGEFNRMNYQFNVAVLNESCPVATSAWIHELLHGYLFYKDVSDSNDADTNHSNPKIWGATGIENIVVGHFQNKICEIDSQNDN